MVSYKTCSQFKKRRVLTGKQHFIQYQVKVSLKLCHQFTKHLNSACSVLTKYM